MIARAPEPPVDDDAAAMVIPELIDRIDSAELEILQDPADDALEEGVQQISDPASGETVEDTGFVIPALARPDYDSVVDDAADVVIPTMVAAAPAVEPSVEQEPVVEPAEPAEEAEAEAEAEDLQEVDAESIESLDSADLEELEQLVAVAVAVESPEPKPPAPPEAKPQPKRRKAWYDDVFAEHFLFLYPLTWEETCQRDAQFIWAQLGAQPGGSEGLTVLDVGCGDGSHAIELAKLGARVTGLDNSLALLLAAAQNKETAGLEDGRVEFIHGDMRRLPRDREFNAAICIGTTLGYFEEEQNWACLQEMHDRLLPGGRLLIHVFNRDFVAPHLPSRSWWQGKRCMVIDEAEMNFFANRLRVHRTIIFDDGRQYEHYMFMRAYTVQDLGKAISQLGMRVIQVSGSRDTAGRFYGSASPDIWIVAEKK
ncbi:MAG TPA: class I SAM-dependent methyltransferase [Enhygromyxa sp.]|nr:class I SAM-dependent methyltransferase [Enhygromyxa sp.]